jgi:Tfp pilus assembly protein PilN
MIQFNLLPDVKLEYIRARRTERLVITISILVSAVALFIFLFLIFSVDVFQKKNMSDLSKDIKKYSSQLQSTPDLNKILTIQNQLGSLPGLHDQKYATSRTFAFIQQLTPANATLSDLKTDFTQNTLTFTGQAPSLDVVNTFADTLKFTKYTTSADSSGDKRAFSNVVLSTFSRTSAVATFTITVNFDPPIFSNADDVTLTVPHIYSTRSEVAQPTDIFKQAPTTTNTGGGL